jgi:hypothetical protein
LRWSGFGRRGLDIHTVTVKLDLHRHATDLRVHGHTLSLVNPDFRVANIDRKFAELG